MKGMGLKLTPVVVRCLLGPQSMFGPMAGTSWNHSPNGPNEGYYLQLPLAAQPPQPPAHPPYRCHS